MAAQSEPSSLSAVLSALEAHLKYFVMPQLLPQGIGKRVTVDQFRLQKRGGVGLKSIRLNDGDALAAINTVTHSPSQCICPASLTLMAHTDRCQNVKIVPLFRLPAVVALTVQEGFVNSQIRQRRRGQFIALASGLCGVLHGMPLKDLLPGSKHPGRTALKLACGYRHFCTSQARELNGVEGERCYPAT